MQSILYVRLAGTNLGEEQPTIASFVTDENGAQTGLSHTSSGSNVQRILPVPGYGSGGVRCCFTVNVGLLHPVPDLSLFGSSTWKSSKAMLHTV